MEVIYSLIWILYTIYTNIQKGSTNLDRRLNLIRNIWNNSTNRLDSNRSIFKKDENINSKTNHTTSKLQISQIMTRLNRNNNKSSFEGKCSLRILKSNINNLKTNNRLINIFKNMTSNNNYNNNINNSINYLDLCLITNKTSMKNMKTNIKNCCNDTNNILDEYEQHSNSLPQVSAIFLLLL